jgi:hypothetical protein
VSRLLASVVAVAPAAADHGGPLRDAPMSPLTAAIVFAGSRCWSVPSCWW